MQCKQCGFLVPQNLKFAIMKNFCPQCGEKLFTEKEMNHISLIQSRVSKQSFAEDLEEQMVYDIALFVYNEATSGYGRVLIDEEIKKILKSATKKEEVGSEESEPSEEITSEEDIEKLKAQIREEEAARVALEGRAEEAGEDLDDRVNRLKNVYRNNPIKQKNTPIRRLDS